VLDPLLPLASSILSIIDNSAESFGTFLAFQCNDAPAHADTAAWGRARCRAWLGNEYNQRRAEPIGSDIPALVLAGEFDPRTPPEYARVVAAGLTQARVLEIPWHGHEYALECVNRIERDFFNAPRGVPASGCLDSLPPLRFVSGVTLGGWTSSIALRAAASPLPVAGLAGVALLLFVPATWVSAVEVRARSGVPEVRRRESLALLLAALAGLVFVFGRCAPCRQQEGSHGARARGAGRVEVGAGAALGAGRGGTRGGRRVVQSPAYRRTDRHVAGRLPAHWNRAAARHLVG
jgi:hypothetical protein